MSLPGCQNATGQYIYMCLYICALVCTHILFGCVCMVYNTCMHSQTCTVDDQVALLLLEREAFLIPENGKSPSGFIY